MKRMLLAGMASACLASAVANCAAAAPAVTLSPAQGHPSLQFGISGTGFGATKAIDVYWDTTDEMPVVSNGSGAIANHTLTVPADALPGTHWVTAAERDNGDLAATIPSIIATPRRRAWSCCIRTAI